jgi:signal transduction histidine kinase
MSKETVDFQWMKEHYFTNKAQTLSVKKGEILLDYKQKNTRLYLVLEGKFLGFLKDSKLEGYPIFEATKDKFIGVYSYFSNDNLSYSRVVAMEDSVVTYYDKPLIDHHNGDLDKILPFLTSVIANELFSRQHYAKKMAKEKQEYVEKLLKAEKMATLGQMAAGLAHELNNSIGVIDSNLHNIEAYVDKTMRDCNDTLLYSFFEKGLKEGQSVSSADARESRQKYESTLGKIDPTLLRKLSKTGLDPKVLLPFAKESTEKLVQAYEKWEMGCYLHDMNIAAKHSAHVVRSVKQLGVAEHQWANDVDVNITIREALAIVQNLTKRVSTEIVLDELPKTAACAGELVQVWINIIKNAIESLVQSNTENPVLYVKSTFENDNIAVSIIDNGPGIPTDIMKKVFEPSFTTKVGGLSFGLGLGLSISQRIISEHEGSIHVTSEKGNTTFTIKIPLKK